VRSKGGSDVIDIERFKEGLEEETLLADGFDEAIVGLGERSGVEIVIYDYGKSVEILVERDELTEEDAHDHMGFNVVGSWVGDGTPMWVHMAE